jgi:hypothetical protein
VSSSVVVAGGNTFSGGTDDANVMSGYGTLQVDCGGFADGLLVSSGGMDNVFGSEVDTTTVGGDTLSVLSDGASSTTTVNSVAVEYVSSGGNDSSATLYAQEGGTLVATTFSGGYQQDGVTDGTQLFTGQQDVNATDNVATVNNGGSQGLTNGVSSGGTQNPWRPPLATTIDSGGFAQVFSGGTEMLRFDPRLDTAGAPISGCPPPDHPQPNNPSSGPPPVMNYPSSSPPPATEGLQTPNLNLLGQYAATQFTSASVGDGGTLIGNRPAVAMTDQNPNSLVAPHHA